MSIELLRKEPTIRMPERAVTLTDEVDVPAQDLAPYLVPVTDPGQVKADNCVRLLNETRSVDTTDEMDEALELQNVKTAVERVSLRVEQQMNAAIEEALSNAMLDLRAELSSQLHLLIKKAVQEELSQRNLR